MIITARNKDGKSDTLTFKNVDRSTRINLYDGTLTGEVSAERQALFPKNFDNQTPLETRILEVDKTLAATESKLSGLPTVGGLSQRESQALYAQMFQVFRGAANFLTHRTGGSALSETMDDFLERLNRDKTLNGSQSGKNTSADLVRNMTFLLSEQYPELLKFSGDLNIASVMASALIKETVTPADVKAFAILTHFSGEGEEESRDILAELQPNTTMSPEAFTAVLGSGLAQFRMYLSSAPNKTFEKNSKAGIFTLQESEAEIETLEMQALQSEGESTSDDAEEA